MKRAHDDCTVAWICALPLEMAAAKTMLNVIHGPLSQPPTDENAYTLGSLGSLNVAIACLPSGLYGVTSAALVLAHMLPNFPSLQFALMIGIGGGVPSETVDIRLGDVAVSEPTATSRGVIHYDYGKSLRGGCFQRTGSLNKPPRLLLTAVSQIRCDSIRGHNPIQQMMSDVLQKQQDMRGNSHVQTKIGYLTRVMITMMTVTKIVRIVNRKIYWSVRHGKPRSRIFTMA